MTADRNEINNFPFTLEHPYKHNVRKLSVNSYWSDGYRTIRRKGWFREWTWKWIEISFYKNGLLDGVSKKFSSKGVLIEEVTYKNGKPNGLAKYFELNGNLKESGQYKDGKRVGKWEYYMDGEIATDEEIKKKKKYQKKKEN